MATTLDLEVINGVDAGKRVRLSPSSTMLLGRSTKGYHVQDELVNVRHAEVAWVTDRYWISDLDTVMGTWVNDERLGPNQPRVISVNDQIRLGETIFVVRERVSFSFEAVARGIGGVTVAGLVAAVIYKIASTPVIYEPKVGWPNPIRYGLGEATILDVPLDFLRKNGFDYHKMRIRRVTDFDQNGVDEMWITHADEEMVVTFDEAGNWVKSSNFPVGCQDQGATRFPNLRCGVVTYAHNGKDYQPVSQEGLVAWMPPVSQAEADGAVGQVVHRPDTWSAPIPYRMTIKQNESFAGFLGERGVVGPVHYLICEEAVPGLSAQVLTEDGRIVALEPGCIRSMTLSGPDRTRRFGAHVPAAIAFTEFGRQQLLEHVRTFLSGSQDGLFLDYRDRQVIKTMSGQPENLLLSYRVGFQSLERHFDPVARRIPAVTQHQLVRSNLGGEGQPQVYSATVLTEGVARLDPDGCSDLVIHTTPWQCAVTRACVPMRGFLTVTDVGCGAPRKILSLPYSGGLASGFSDGVEVRAQVDSQSRGIQTDVLRTRVAFRYPNQ